MKTEINKIAREIARLNPIERDELVSVLMNSHNISATLYHFGAVSTNEIHQECDLRLIRTGERKLQLIKTIKETFGLGLKDAKDIVDSAPCYLKEFMPVAEGEKIRDNLEEIGATIEILYHE